MNLTGLLTEQPNPASDHIDALPTGDVLAIINQEDQKVASAVQRELPQITQAVDRLVDLLRAGGRLFYIGAGTSGRLGIMDAAECSPSFGVPDNLVIGIIAGGEKAITKAVEFAEDDIEQGWKDLKRYKVNTKDVVIGIAASGTTPYVVGALEKCRKNKICFVKRFLTRKRKRICPNMGHT